MHLPQSCLLLLALAASAPLHAQIEPPPTRGALLYSTHCIECHTTSMHWRDQRLAHDWESLRNQVRRWQGEARLGWSEEDVEAVVRHLNATIYHFPAAQARR